ncbi:MAG TPA: hypothetical protein VG603_14785 [Chitinophagales bacterium]|nr:hypothetical protein [Chitinophagales bacterium]
MKKQIKNIVRIVVLAATGIVLITSMPSCKANKCDCPTFGGHRLNHNS